MNVVEIRVINVDNPIWLSELESFCLGVIKELGKDDWNVSVVICDDEFIRDLNETYRGIEGPTDVLSFPQEAVVEGYVKDKEAVSLAIKNLVRNLKARNKNVATSISGFSVIIKKIMMGHKNESELEATIQEEAEQYIPFDINEVNLDFDILTPEGEPQEAAEGETREESDRMEVMLVAAKKDIIDDYVGLLGLAGLNPPDRLVCVDGPSGQCGGIGPPGGVSRLRLRRPRLARGPGR